MSRPTDETLYNKTKDEVDKSYPKPSAYRSMAYTREYLAAFREKYGNNKKPYTGDKRGNLQRWRNEKWIDVKSYLENPKEPVACGNVEYGKNEYPLCMPKSKAAKYSRGELQLLVKRKSELKDKRLVKDAFLRDVLKPKEIPPERKFKQKYKDDGRLPLPKPLSAEKAKKIEKEKPIGQEVKTKPRLTEEEKQRRQEEKNQKARERTEARTQRDAQIEEKKRKKESDKAIAEEMRRVAKETREQAKTTAAARRPSPLVRMEGPVTISFD
jgi:hypothetical protein